MKGIGPETGTDCVARPDVDLASCDPNRLRFVIEDRAMAVGDYCDDIQMCIATGLAAAVETIEPGFNCNREGPQGCPTGQRRCVWNDPDDIDAAEYARLCEITLLVDGPESVGCYLYL